MSVSLGPITFIEEDFILRGLTADRVAVDVQRSDEGVVQILVADMEGGRKLELYGWLTRAEEDAVLSLSEGKVAVPLSHYLFSGDVVVLGTSCEDEFEYADPGPDDYRIGSIYLLEV
jgi:hypothetical protein